MKSLSLFTIKKSIISKQFVPRKDYYGPSNQIKSKVHSKKIANSDKFDQISLKYSDIPETELCVRCSTIQCILFFSSLS